MNANATTTAATTTTTTAATTTDQAWKILVWEKNDSGQEWDYTVGGTVRVRTRMATMAAGQG